MSGRFDSGHGRPLIQVTAPMQTDVRVWRTPDGTVLASVPHSVVWHSPTGFECGYAGSGPADLALNILNAFVPPGRPLNYEAEDLDAELEREDLPETCYRGQCSRFAARHHQRFKVEFIMAMPRAGGTIAAADIRRFIDARRAERRGGGS